MKPVHSTKRFLFVVVTLLLLLVIGLALVNHFGWREWDKYRRDLEAKGESLDWRKFIPPRVPDEQNFAMTPLLRPLFDFVTEEGHLFPRDTNAVARVEHLFDGVGYLGGAWWRGRFSDFLAWQGKLRGRTNKSAVIFSNNKVRSAPWVITETNRSEDQPEMYWGIMIVPEAGVTSSADFLPASLGKKDATVATWLLKPPAASAAEDLLELLRLNSAELEELRIALKRPYARFDIPYDLEWEAMLLPHLGVLKKFTRTFQEKALAELATENTREALEDFMNGLAVGDTVKDEPALTSGLARTMMISMMIQPVWEGLARGQWTSNQIALIQTRIEGINLVDDMLHTLRGNRAGAIRSKEADSERMFESNLVMRICVSGWIDKNLAAFAKAYEKYVLPPFNPFNRTVNLPLNRQLFESAPLAPAASQSASAFLSGTLFLSGLRSACLYGQDIAWCQAKLHLAATACALERYRFARGEYPERLELLSPDYLTHALCDPVNGQPLKYRRTDTGRFVLYSVGWNGVDDGGQYVLSPFGLVITKKSDWVWSYPSNAAAGPRE